MSRLLLTLVTTLGVFIHTAATAQEIGPVGQAGAQENPFEGAPKTIAWSDVEAQFAKVRAELKTSNVAWSDLTRLYDSYSQKESLGSRNFPDHFKKLSAWQSEFPKSPTPLIVQARSYILYGWEARGNGTAITVTEEGQELFRQRIDQAQRSLEDALKLEVKDAEVYSQLLVVAKAKGLPLEQAREWIDQGSKVDPTYYSLYQSMAEYLLPRWHGNRGDIEKFSAELVQRLPGDDGLAAFGLVAARIHSYEDLIFDGSYDRELLGKSALILAKRYPDTSQIVDFAALSTLAAQNHNAAKQIQPLVRRFSDMTVWRGERLYRQFQEWANASEIRGGEDFWISASPDYTRGFAFSDDQKSLWRADGGGRPCVRLVNLESKGMIGSLPGPDQGLEHFAFDPGSSRAAAAYRGTAFLGWIVWDLKSAEIIGLHPTEGTCHALAINPSSKQVAWVEESSLCLMDAVHPSEMAKATSSGAPAIEPQKVELEFHASALKYSPDGKRVAAWGASQCKVFDAANGKVILELGSDAKNGSASLRVNELLAVDNEGRVWTITFVSKSRKMGGGRHLIRYSADGSTSEEIVNNVTPGCVALSPDRKLLAVARTVRPPRPAPGTPPPPPPSRPMLPPCEIVLQHVSTGAEAKVLPGHWHDVGTLVFSQDSSKLASMGRQSDVIKIWQLRDLKPE